MKQLITLNIIILLVLSAFSQDFENACYKINNPYIKRIYKEALNQMRFSPNTAYSKMLKAVKIQPKFTEGYLLLATIDYQRGMTYANVDNPPFNPRTYFEKAVKNFKIVVDSCPQTNDYIAYYYLGEYYYDNRDFEKAKYYLDSYTENNSSDYELLRSARLFLKDIKKYNDWKNNPVEFKPISLENVNTVTDEFLPVLSPDGEMLLYTRKYLKMFAYDQERMVEEFTFSTRLKNNTDSFSIGKPMPKPFNEGQDQGGASITIDNKQLYITLCEPLRTKHTSYKNCDIYVSNLDKDKWTQLTQLGPTINGDDTWEAQPSISADGRVLFFASARKGGFGGIDIYRSVRDSAGNWGKAENLGADINTTADDKTPYIHTDGRTLYFSSKGWFGLGGFDIFYSKYVGNGRWSEPENIGYPINTNEDEIAFSFSADGEKLYFASKKFKGKGGWDIYSAEIPEKVKPEKVIFFRGRLYDKDGNIINNAMVELQSITNLKLTKGLVDPNTGRYAIATGVNDNEDFIITVKKEGYFFKSEYIRPNRKLLGKPYEKDFELRPIEIGTKMRLENIYFDTNSAEFDEVSTVSLNNFVEFLKLNPTLKIELYGHTDNVGDVESNLTLSRERAKAVYMYLAKHGIDPKRADYKGFGESKPIATNATRKGRALNRRTEFVVIVK